MAKRCPASRMRPRPMRSEVMTVPLMEMVLAPGARRLLLFLFVVVLLGVLPCW